jgi:hypothetical protein
MLFVSNNVRSIHGQTILLPNHNHDVWTDTCLDQAFYEWYSSSTIKR